MSSTDYVFSLSDGTTTVTLTSAPWALIEYVPTPPPAQLDRSKPVGYWGETLTGVQFGNVAETLSLRYTGASGSAVSAVQSIERLLRQAEKNNTAIAPVTVYLKAQNSASSDVYRSPIYAGRVEWHPRTLGEYWRSDVFQADLIIERAPWWESETPVTIEPTVNQAIGATAVSYTADANVVLRQLAYGDVQAPIDLQFKNVTLNGASDTPYGEIVVLHYAGGGGGDHSFWGGTSGVPTGRAMVSASGAGVTPQYVAYAYGDGDTSGSAIRCDWAATTDVALVRGEDDNGSGYAAYSDQFGGAPTLFTLKLASPCLYSDLYLWLEASYKATGLVFDETTPVLAPANAEFVRLGIINVPPVKLPYTVTQPAICYTIYARRAGTPSAIQIASIQMAAADEQRIYSPLTSGSVVTDGYLIDSQSAGVYTLNASGSAAQANYQAIGAPLTFTPSDSDNNQYVFYFSDTSGSSRSGYTGYFARVHLTYRPRRVTL